MQLQHLSAMDFVMLSKTNTFFLVSFFVFTLPNNLQKIRADRSALLTWEEEKFPDKEAFSKYLYRCMEYQQNPQPIKIHNGTFNILKNAALEFEDQNILSDLTTWKDLNLFSGKNSQASSLVDKVLKTQTEIGKAYSCYMLGNPTTDIPELQRRQAIIKELVTNNELFNSLDALLKEFKEYEKLLLSFWVNDQIGNAFNRQGSYLRFSLFGKFINKLNKNAYCLDYWNITAYNAKIIISTSNGLATLALPTYVLSMLFGFNLPSGIKQYAKDSNVGSAQLALVKWLYSKIDLKDAQKYIKYGGYLGTSILLASETKASIGWIYDSLVLESCMRYKLSIVASFTKIVSKISKNIEDANLNNLKLSENFHKIAKKDLESKELKKLLEQLNGSTFKKGKGYFFRRGPVLAAYSLLSDNKNSLTPVLAAIGELDAYMAAARNIKEGKYCFAEFLKAEKPYINLDDFWNPLINKDVAVPNSISLDSNMILTGPNAGGKSTIIKGIAVNLVLAQTFGISASKQMLLTPFSKISTCLNIVDDIASGNSLFKSEVLRIEELIKLVENLEVGKFSFLAIDEMFSGTSPKEGAAAAYGVAKYLGQFKNSIFVIATHFKELTNLEKASSYINYKVAVEFDDTGNIKFPFKLSLGVSDQNIAFDILKAEGFDSKILDNANELLKGNV